jgi:uncharacterized membrane protein
MSYPYPFDYQPTPGEYEKSSNAYLMSLVAIFAGLPIPVVNLIASFGFWFATRKATRFIRWHALQMALSHLALLFVNGYAIKNIVALVFGYREFSSTLVFYLVAAGLLNVIMFFSAIRAAAMLRKGKNPRWPVFCHLADALVKKR